MKSKDESKTTANKTFFSIQNLLSEDKDGKVSGPMSPLLFAKEMGSQLEVVFNRLARVYFNNNKINQCYEKGEGMTGYDTLIIGCQYKDNLWLSLWVDMGIGGMPVAERYQSDWELSVVPLYTQSKFVKKLTEQQVREIFDFVFENPAVLAITKDSNKIREPKKTK